MERLRMSATEYKYQEIDRQLNEQFIHGLSDHSMLLEIICEFKAVRDTKEVNNDQVLLWASWLEAQRMQLVLNNVKLSKQFDAIQYEM